jgi:hypothetical protein
MKRITALLLASALLIPLSSNAEILALLNYESKPNDSLKDLKMPFGTQVRCRRTWWRITCSITRTRQRSI